MITTKRTPIILGVVLAAGIAAGGEPAAQASATPATPPAKDAFADELASLVAAYEKAFEDYLTRWASKGDDKDGQGTGDDKEAGSGGGSVDQPAAPTDVDEVMPAFSLVPEDGPDAEYAARFQDLARRAVGTDSAAEAWVWVVELSGGSGKSAAVREAIDTLLVQHPHTQHLERLAGSLGFLPWQHDEGVARATLQRIAAVTPHRAVKGAALFNLALVHIDESPDGDKDKAARKLLDRLCKEFTDTDYAKMAEAFVFELEHLQVGMVAPDIVGVDVGGKPISLSSYRGQVVVLDFWGFW